MGQGVVSKAVSAAGNVGGIELTKRSCGGVDRNPYDSMNHTAFFVGSYVSFDRIVEIPDFLDADRSALCIPGYPGIPCDCDRDCGNLNVRGVG